jgi:hypothetical protein
MGHGWYRVFSIGMWIAALLAMALAVFVYFTR